MRRRTAVRSNGELHNEQFSTRPQRRRKFTRVSHALPNVVPHVHHKGRKVPGSSAHIRHNHVWQQFQCSHDFVGALPCVARGVVKHRSPRLGVRKPLVTMSLPMVMVARETF